MAKVKKQTDSKGDDDAPATIAEAAEPKKGFIGKLVGNKKMLIMAGAGLVLLLGGLGGGAYYFLVLSKPPATVKTADAIPLTPPEVAYFDVPDVIVNIQSADGSPAYLKLSSSLELDSDKEKAGVTVLMPRIVDQFQGYLRELRIDDLKGSAGVIRLKEELLRRINVAAAPYHVRDVLLKQMIVQ